jgi:hypothetical protein
MSTITINISKDADLKSSADVASTSYESTDGGSPNFGDAETSSTSQLDIGGPPAWLADAIGGHKKSGDKKEADAPGATSNGEDGGAAKVELH